MIPLKGMWKNSPFSKQPNGFAYHVLNGIIKKNIGAYTNEGGASEFSSQYNALNISPIGIFNAKYGKKVICSVSNTGSHIGIINSDGTYNSKIIADLGFSIDNPIDAEIQYNFKGDLIFAFTDGVQSPKIINLDNVPSPFNINEIQLFSKFLQPKIETEIIETGGALVSGVYFPVFKFKNNDGAETTWTANGNPVSITEDILSEGYNNYDGVKPNTITSKAIQINLTNVDVNYDKIVIGIVSKIDGILVAKEVKEEIINSDTITTVYTGNESGTIIDLINITTPSANYATIKHLTQVEGILYGAGVTENAPIDFQKYANLIKLKFNSELVTVRNLNESSKVHQQNNKRRGYAHGEVMAYYIKLKLVGSGWTRGFLISGRAPEGNEDALNSSLVAGDTTLQFDLSISSSSRYYQIRDTTGVNGKFGYWQNENELYPNTLDFAPVEIAPGVFSEDLRGKKVRHHKFPTIKKMKDSLYSSETDYGRTKLDILSIEIDSFPDLPNELTSIIEGYEICYAKRTPTNSTVNGMSLALMGAKRGSGAPEDHNTYTTGGNWQNRERGDGNKNSKKDPVQSLYADNTKLRMHSFDLLLNKPAITPSYISNEIKLTATDVANKQLEVGPATWAYWLDYMDNHSNVATDVPLADRYKKINDFKYVPAGTISGDIINYIGEEVITAKIDGAGLTLATADNGMNLNDEETSRLTFEETYLLSIMSYKTDIYNSFFNQVLASTGKFSLLTDAYDNIYGGDVFISEFSFITQAPRIFSDIAEDVNPDNTTAVKTLRCYLCECINNPGFRYEDETNVLTKYFPKQTIGFKSYWFGSIGRGRNVNTIAYNKDYTSVNDLMLTLPFNPYDIFVAEDPYKIVRSKPASTEERHTSWQTFLANDYYIIQRDKGFISNIEAIADNLFINTEFTLLKTRGSSELATDAFKVVLGTGNIFDRPPLEVTVEKTGYAGCQHKHSCLLTRFGYFFVDEDKSKIFLATEEAEDITISLAEEFKTLLNTTGDNPFNLKGYTVAWDEENERIILSSLEADFTLSYYPALKSWTSYHSYRPYFLIGDRNSLFGLKDDKIYKLNDANKKGIYFDETINPFEVVVVFNMEEGVNKTFANLTWFTEYILDGAEQRDITFDKISLWNSYQASGNMNLVPFNNSASFEDNYTTANIRRTKREWLFNKFRDKVTQRNIKFMDGVDVIDSALSSNLTFEYLKRFSDNFLVVKYSFSNKKIGSLQGEIRLLDLGVSYNTTKR